ncbi:hypothetical protein IAT38_004235 [Cryptococcus sp. DSM 104549]
MSRPELKASGSGLSFGAVSAAGSPLDWSNFMTFQTPPGSQPGPAHQYDQGSGGSSGGHGVRPEDQYQNFAQGIAMSHPHVIHFQQPQRRMTQPPRQPAHPAQHQPHPQAQHNPHQPPHQPPQHHIPPPQYQSHPHPSPRSHPQNFPSYTQHTPPQGPGTGQSPHSMPQSLGQGHMPLPADQRSAKGKSPAMPAGNHLPHSGTSSNAPLPRTADNHGGGGNSESPAASSSNHDNGLTLDPSAFSRDIRFQVPSFLTNQVGGAPSFPPGSEAWSGFGGPGMFGSTDTVVLGGPGAGPLTPGSMFGNSSCGVQGQHGQLQQHLQQRGQHGQEGAYCGNEVDRQNQRAGANPLGTWGTGQHEYDKGGEQHPGMGGMFYVNPNPSPNVLAQRTHHQPQGHQRQFMGAGQQQQAQSQEKAVEQQQQQGSARDVTMSSPRENSRQAQQHPSNYLGAQQQSQPSLPSSSPHPSHGSHPSGSMPTSAILPPQLPFPPNQHHGNHVNHSIPQSSFSNVPSVSISSGNTVNFASSSTAPYVPPPSAQTLIQGPMPPAHQALVDGPGLYSTTGFDMLGVLGRVAARKDPSAVLGPVDLSCSFVVVDIRRYDSPIVYASPTFTQLTGYELPQILGKNCRFLQSPEGDVVKGSKREYTDNEAVSLLKRTLDAGKECQTSLINYRRGGDPFINLVTVVPIPWDGTDIVYHVGFQINLVEQPNVILNNMKNGSYRMDYTYATPPEKPLKLAVGAGPGGREQPAVMGLSAEVLEVMGSRANVAGAGSGSAQSEEAGRMEWLKMVLDNTDDFVHALSLKGFFQYVSPSVRRVLGYEPEELLNKNISEFTNTHDIVPLIRELKDSTHAGTDGQPPKPVRLVFRFQKKHGGYVWVESIGRLVVEAGKGRKAVILSGRIRSSVPTLTWDPVAKHGGLAQTEFWSKMSFQGLILHATAGTEQVLGQRPEDVAGQSFFSLLPGGSDGPPTPASMQSDPVAAASHSSRVFNVIRQVLQGDAQATGGGVSVQHKVVTRSGVMEDVVSTFYVPRAVPPPSTSAGGLQTPADSDDSPMTSADGGSPSPVAAVQKPTTLLVQTKLVSASPPPGMMQLPSTVTTGTNSRPISAPLASDIFEELAVDREGYWSYDLHQLRNENARLREEIEDAKARGAGKKSKKRKALDMSSGPVDVVEAVTGGRVGRDMEQLDPKKQLAFPPGGRFFQARGGDN